MNRWHACRIVLDSGPDRRRRINYYSHCTRTPVADILLATRLFYGLPIAITEPGWPDGNEGNWFFPDITDQAGCLRHVQQEIARSGVRVEGVCWYPWLDMPAWGSAGTFEQWPGWFPVAAWGCQTINALVTACDRRHSALLGDWL